MHTDHKLEVGRNIFYKREYSCKVWIVDEKQNHSHLRFGNEPVEESLSILVQILV